MTKSKISEIKEGAKSLTWLVNQIESLELDLKMKQEANNLDPGRFPQSDLDINIRYINGYHKNIKKIIQSLNKKQNNHGN